MLPKERGRSAIGEFGVGLIVMLSAHAREGVVHAGIGVNGHMRIALEAVDDLFLRRRWHVLILAGNVEHERLLDGLGLAKQRLDVHAVIADGGIRGPCARR